VAFIGCPTEDEPKKDETAVATDSNQDGGSSSPSGDSSSSSAQSGDNASSSSSSDNAGDSSSSSQSGDDSSSSSSDNAGDNSSSSQSADDSSSSSSSDDSSSQSSSDSGNENQGGQQQGPDSNKITRLQLVIDDTPEKGVINLSQYTDITDFSATINKAVTIQGSQTSMLNSTLTVASSGVSLSGMKNVSVTASPSLGNGSLKISGSSLSSLKINGGGIGSIVLEDASIDNVIVDKDMTAQDAEYVRVVVDNDVKVGNLKAASPLFLDGVVSNDTWLGSLDLSTDGINIAISKDVSVDLGSTFVNVACYNDDASTDRLQMNIAMKKGSDFNTDLFGAAFTKEFGDLTYDVNEFAKDIAEMVEDLGKNPNITNYDIYLVMNSLEITLIVKDLPNYVGAMYLYGSIPGISWTYLENADETVKEKCLKEVKNGTATFHLSEIPIKKQMTVGGTEEGFQFYLLPMENKTTYIENKDKDWDATYFTPSISGSEAEQIYTIKEKDRTTDEYVIKPYCKYVILHEWCAIGGTQKIVDGQWDKEYPSFNIKFDDLLKPENYKNNTKYCTITIDKESYPQMYYADSDNPTQISVPCYPNNVISRAPTLFVRDNYLDETSDGYSIKFSANPND
jgi:hypothetical protein